MSLTEYSKKVVAGILVAFAAAFATASASTVADNDTLTASCIRIELLASVSDADSSTFIIPFSRAGNLILVQAKADTTEGNFVLDTGCPHLVLNLTYFRDYPINANDEDRKGITGAKFTASRTTVASFSFGTARYYRLQADLANLGSIENTKGVKILGLIGMQLLDKFEMIIDYEKNLIYLHRISRKEASSYQHEMLKDTSNYNVVPIAIT